MTKRRPRPPRDAAGRAMVVVALVALSLITALVAVAAFSSWRASSEQAGTVPQVPSFTAPPPTSSEPAAPPLPVASVFLTAFDDESALFARRGDCRSAPPEIMATDDGGASWSAFNGAQVRMGQLVALQLQSKTIATAVHRRTVSCELDGARSFTGGRFWEGYPALLGEASFLNPDDPGVVVMGGQPVASPCERPIQLAEGGASDVLLCDGDEVFELVDGAWTGTTVPGAYAVGASADRVVFAVAGDEECAGTQLRALTRPLPSTGDEAPPSEVLACLPETPAPGSTAIAVAGSSVWLLDATGVRRSPDGGISW